MAISNGATSKGGPAGTGVVFKLDTAGQESVLYAFTYALDGTFPFSGLFRDSAGNLYGTTCGGGISGAGVVYKLEPSGHEKVLYSFAGEYGACNSIGLVRDAAGNFYGATPGDMVYKLDPAGNLTVLHQFTGYPDGESVRGVICDAAGNVFGTTGSGGASNWGIVFKVDTSGHETVLYNFTGGADGGGPSGGVIRDQAGNLYGTTCRGAAADMGVVYKLDSSGHETILYSFTGGTDGGCPGAGVIRDSAGNLYGTNYQGGAGTNGVLYKLDKAGHLAVLHSFEYSDGTSSAGVVRDGEGNLYGTTLNLVYKLDASGQYTVLFNLPAPTMGGTWEAGVILDPAGNLYGTIPTGGTKGGGSVFELAQP